MWLVPRRPTVIRALYPIATICLASMAIIGCGDSAAVQTDAHANGDPAVSVQPASFTATSARDLLGLTLARYRNAASYRDRGRAEISYQNAGKTETRAAPMRVWFDRNELYLETYDVRLTSDPDGLTAWIADPSTDNFDSQVLKSAPILGRPDSKELLADPILAGRVAGGLAGPPPQLEWLFSPAPMKKLFAADHQFAFGPTQLVDRRNCRCVIVDAQAKRYQFWIDDQAGLVRRIDLPPIVAPLEPGATAQPIRLSIDFVDATFNPPDQAPSIDRLPESPKMVSRFVTLPPPRPARILGTRVEAFRKSGDDTSVTMLVRVSIDANTIAAAMTAQAWCDQWPDALAEQVRPVILVDQNAANTIPKEMVLPVVVDRSGQFAESLEIDPGAAVLIDPSGRVMWVESDFSPSTAAAFGSIIGDVLSGVDVPDRLRTQWTERVAAYDRICGEVAIKSR